MQDLIKQKLIEFHATCDVDKWGQKGTLSMYEVFGTDHKAIAEYVKENKGVLRLSTYGGRFGTWVGISEIVDADIKSECSKAFDSNPNRRLAMTR
jgi:hypothetical protein